MVADQSQDGTLTLMRDLDDRLRWPTSHLETIMSQDKELIAFLRACREAMKNSGEYSELDDEAVDGKLVELIGAVEQFSSSAPILGEPLGALTDLQKTRSCTPITPETMKAMLRAATAGNNGIACFEVLRELAAVEAETRGTVSDECLEKIAALLEAHPILESKDRMDVRKALFSLGTTDPQRLIKADTLDIPDRRR